ncbi:TIGR03089 family protein [Phytoactinopolyspora alkaliphila]|nr:TIGR03089 family protein [Phytoactinopolyspora alkaliphila]
MVSTPHELLRGELARDGSRPLVTFYDDATGERVELSVTTFDNWVAKTSGLLRDDLSADAGDRVGLLLPPHWQSLVWAGACWALGASVVDSTDDAAVLVTGPDTLQEAAVAGVGEVVALSLRPLGGRFTEPLPIGVLDYAVEVPAHPDVFSPYAPPPAHTPAYEMAGQELDLGELVARARARAEELGVGDRPRLLVTADELPDALLDALLVPLVTGGSAVLVRNERRSGRDERLAAERVTAVA